MLGPPGQQLSNPSMMDYHGMSESFEKNLILVANQEQCKLKTGIMDDARTKHISNYVPQW